MFVDARRWGIYKKDMIVFVHDSSKYIRNFNFVESLGQIGITLAKKKWRIFRTNFARVNISNLGFFCLSHESVSNLLFNSERFIQIDECSEEQQSYYKHRGHWWIAQFLSTMHFPKNNNHLWEALINKWNQIKTCGFHHYIEHAKL